jgi:hypothetical protein
MKYALIFLLVVVVGGGIALSLMGIPAPKSEQRIPITVNVKNN